MVPRSGNLIFGIPAIKLGDVLEKDNESSGYLSGYLTYSDNADLALILPYYENQMTFELNDKKTGALLKKVNMSQAIIKFQSNYPKDPRKYFSISYPIRQSQSYI